LDKGWFGMAKFEFKPLSIPDVIHITPRRFGDHRGYFVETYSVPVYAEAGITAVFVQDNESLSAKVGTLRGLHFQAPPSAQAKLVRVLAGAAFDVAVDIRTGSPTYGRWCGATLTADGGEQMFIPRGFAHGFCTVEPDTIFSYKMDNVYDPNSEQGLAWNDPGLAIEWPIAAGEEPIVSGKDGILPTLAHYSSPFSWAG